MGRRTKRFEKYWQRGLKHYILYFMENDNLKTEWISSVSTECIVLVWFIKYVVTIIMKKEFAYRLSDRQLDDIFEVGNMVPHENV